MSKTNVLDGPILNEFGVSVEWMNPATLDDHPENRSADRGLEFAELCESMRALGVVNPLIVRKLAFESFQILGGHRRRRAAVEIGLKQVPCIVLNECSDDDAMAIMVVENFERKQLNQIEEAEAIDAAMRMLEWDEAKCARKFARDVNWVQLSLRLLDLPKEARKFIESGAVKRDTVAAVVALPDVEERLQAVQLCFWPGGAADALSGPQARQMISEMIIKPREAARKWNAAREALEKKLVKEWAKKTKGKEALLVRVPEHGEAKRMVDEVRGGWVRADEMIAPSACVASVESAKWADLAIIHGLPGYYLPVLGEGLADVYVRKDLLTSGEESRAAGGFDTILAFGDKVERAKNVQDAVDEMDGVFPDDDEADGAPPDSRTVERAANSTMIVNGDRVRALRERLLVHAWGTAPASGKWPEKEFPAGVFDFEQFEAGYWCDALDWILKGCPEIGD